VIGGLAGEAGDALAAVVLVPRDALELVVWGLVSAVICDSLRSFPVSSGGPFGCPGVPGGKYLKRYQAVPLVEPTTSRFAGTGSICEFAGFLPPYGSRS